MNKEESGGGSGLAGVVVAVRFGGGGVSSCVGSFGAPELGLHLSLGRTKISGVVLWLGLVTTKCSPSPLPPLSACVQRAHITRARRIGCIMQSSNERPLLL